MQIGQFDSVRILQPIAPAPQIPQAWDPWAKSSSQRSQAKGPKPEPTKYTGNVRKKYGHTGKNTEEIRNMGKKTGFTHEGVIFDYVEQPYVKMVLTGTGNREGQ